MKSFFRAGFNLVEAVVAIALASAFLLALSYVNNFYLQAALGQDKAIEASFLAEEGLEAARYMRDESWSARISNLSTTTDYYLYWSNAGWQATTTPTNISGFDRRLRLAQVQRDASQNIVSNAGIVDSGTRLITSTVSWVDRGQAKNKSLSFYLTDIFSN